MARPKQLTLATTIAKQAACEFGERFHQISFLETGATSTVYLFITDRTHYVLRIATPRPGETSSYESDFAVRSALARAGQPVATPIATDQSIRTMPTAGWAIDEYRSGQHPARGEITTGVSRQLGRVLRVLHSLAAEGFGQLQNTRSRFCGAKKNAVDGMLTRFEQPWPFTKNALATHPSVKAKPSLYEKLLAQESWLRSFVLEGNPVVTHSDLHEGQILVDNGRLTALLDFNDAGVARCEWDFGSYLYFHGESALSDLVDGYTSEGVDSNSAGSNRAESNSTGSVSAGSKSTRSEIAEKAKLLDRAKQAATLIALHHGNRGVVLKRPHRIAASVRFLEQQFD